jgi:hypothetical protein
MIQPIKWPNFRSDEPISPFSRGGIGRPLRITFHSSTLAAADGDELRAANLLRELARHPGIESIDSEHGPLPLLEIGDYRRGGEYTIPITVTHKTGQKTRAAIWNAEQLFIATGVAETADSDAAFHDFLIAQASHELDYDILITLSPYLICNRDKTFIRCANPRTPVEAAQIIGLFLRAGGKYVFEAAPNWFQVFDRRSIYKVLLRHKLPNMWGYVKACAHAESVREDGIAYLAESILIRCVRALEARDEIGVQFYLPQNSATRDAIMYHFDYLTLLLMGAFDAQARVARRVYGINRPDERNTGFHHEKFLKALKRSADMTLYNLVSDRDFSDLMVLLLGIRHSIHGAVWPTIAYGGFGEPEESFIKVPATYKHDVWEAAQRCDSAQKWGLLQDPEFLLLEPYTYAISLVAECFRQIDSIAALTDVTRLFPDNYAVPELQHEASDDDNFENLVRQQIVLLG